MQNQEQYGREEEIIASMVKSRECCRKAAQAIQTARDSAASRPACSKDNLNSFAAANNAVTQMLAHLQKVPAKIGKEMRSDTGKQYASRLLAEIGDILEKAMIMEREMRETQAFKPGEKTMTQRATRAAQAYAHLS